MWTFVKMIFLAGLLLGLGGWDFSKHNIPLNEISSGGPDKDGIPAIDRPRFVLAEQADKKFMKASDRVLGLVVNSKQKAYPIKILNWHEIVNDRIGGQPVVVTFCPLCGTGMVFHARIPDRELSFGVSGLLYQSDMLLYDRATESLWSQIKKEAVTGPLTGTRLRLIPATYTTWGAWKKKHPDTLVLSTKTGYLRDYDRDPYAGYEKTASLMFGVSAKNKSYHPKERVIGVEIAGASKVYPFSELARAKLPIKDVVGKKNIRILFNKKTKTAVIQDEKGKELPSVVGFWFAWFAFHPETDVYQAAK